MSETPDTEEVVLSVYSVNKQVAVKPPEAETKRDSRGIIRHGGWVQTARAVDIFPLEVMFSYDGSDGLSVRPGDVIYVSGTTVGKDFFNAVKHLQGDVNTKFILIPEREIVLVARVEESE